MGSKERKRGRETINQKIKMISYGIGIIIIGLIASAVIDLHVASKYLLVRILRNALHLQSNSVVLWTVWYIQRALSLSRLQPLRPRVHCERNKHTSIT
jgi:hypothetical protein